LSVHRKKTADSFNVHRLFAQKPEQKSATNRFLEAIAVAGCTLLKGRKQQWRCATIHALTGSDCVGGLDRYQNYLSRPGDAVGSEPATGSMCATWCIPGRGPFIPGWGTFCSGGAVKL
jgi:hypothetical protein